LLASNANIVSKTSQYVIALNILVSF